MNSSKRPRRPSFRLICQAVSFALFCCLLFYVAWPYSRVFAARVLADKEYLPAESFLNLDPLVERRVTSECTGCGTCVAACPFGAVADDFSTRHLDCASCRTCSRVCPADAVQFTWRRKAAASEPPASEAALSRRAFILSAAGGGPAPPAPRPL